MGSLLRWRSQPAINLLHRLTGLLSCPKAMRGRGDTMLVASLFQHDI
jgi:hypothetical protein